MSYWEFTRRTITAVVVFILCNVAVIVLWNLCSFLLIVFTAWVIFIGIEVFVNWLEKLGLRRVYAIMITIFGTVIAILVGIALILPPIVTQFVDLANALPDASDEIVQEYETFYNENDNFQRFLPEFTYEDYQSLVNPSEGDDGLLDTEDGESSFDVTSLVGTAVPILGGIGSFLGDLVANFMLILFVTLYFVIDPMSYYRGIIAFTPTGMEQRAIDLLNKVRQIVMAWLGSLLVSIGAQATMVYIALGLVLNIPNALALALVAGISNIIPNIGFYLAAIPVILVTAAHDIRKLPFVIIAYIVLGETEGKFITPQVVQSRLSLPAGLVLIFQLIAAAFLGFFGLLLAVPILAICLMLIDELYVRGTLGKDHVFHVMEAHDGVLHLVDEEDDIPTAPRDVAAISESH